VISLFVFLGVRILIILRKTLQAQTNLLIQKVRNQLSTLSFLSGPAKLSLRRKEKKRKEKKRKETHTHTHRLLS